MGHCFSWRSSVKKQGEEGELQEPSENWSHQGGAARWSCDCGRMKLLLEMRHWNREGGGECPGLTLLPGLPLAPPTDGVQLYTREAGWCRLQGSASQGTEQQRRAEHGSGVGWEWLKSRVTSVDLNGGKKGYTSIRSSFPAKTFLFPCSPPDTVNVWVVEMRPGRYLGEAKLSTLIILSQPHQGGILTME